MKVTALRIENFMALGAAHLTLNDKGLVLIQGVNADDPSTISNGAGKSSIPDALSWCLFGSTARGVTGDAVINRNAKSALVEVHINDDGDSYKLRRTRKHSKYKNRFRIYKYESVPVEDGMDFDWVDLTKGTDKETQELANKIIGCDLQVFNAAVYQGQERMPDLPNYTDKQLKELVEEAAGITVLQDCHALARAQMRGAEAKVTHWFSEVESAEKDVERAKTQIDTLERQTKDWQSNQKTRLKLYDNDRIEQDGIVADLQERYDTAAAKLPAISGKIEELQKALKKRDEYTERREEFRRAEKATSDAKVAAQAEHAHAEKSRDAKAEALSNVEARVGSNCGECGKEIVEADLHLVIEAAQAKLEAADAARLTASDVLRKAQEAHDVAKQALIDYEATIPDFTETAEKLGELKNIKLKIENLGASLKAAQEKQESILSEWKKIKTEKSPYGELLENAKTELKDAKHEVRKAKKELARHQDEFAKHEKVVEVYSPAGVRAHILDHVTPFLNSRTAHYLSVLSDANLQAEWSTLSKTAKGELREKFSIDVRNATGGDQFGLLSGGEKRKVRLACAMALQDVVSGRALKPIDLFMADEIDDALDEAGLERLMAILDEKARERGTVLVISHRSLSDWIREVCLVTKEKGKSTITGALAAKETT